MPLSRRLSILRVRADWVMTLLVTGPAVAHAANESSGVVVESYDAANGCPTEDVFRAQLERRAQRFASGTATLRVAVRVERSPHDLVGTILVTDADGTRSSRKVNGARCEEIVSTLALVAALAVEEASRTSESAAKEAAPEPPVPAPPPSLAEPADARPLSPPPRTRAPARSFALRFGAQAAAQSGATPNVVMTVPVFVEVSLDDTRRTSRLRAGFEPSMRAVGVFGGNDRTTVGTAAAEFWWTSGILDACPLRIRVRTVSLAPCARIEIGVLSARGERIVPAKSDSRMWTAFAVPVRLRIEPWPHVFIELEGAARTPFVRDRYVFTPDSAVFKVPVLGWTAAAGAGVGFP